MAHLMPLLMIKALAQFFQVGRVAILSEDGLSDEELQAMASLPVKMYASVEGLGGTKLMHDTVDTLIIDMASYHIEVGSDQKWFMKNMYWLVPNDKSFVPPEALRLDSNFLTVQEQNYSFDLTEWYRIKGSLDSLVVGTWDDDAEVLNIENPDKWERRSNLHGLNLRVVAEPWVFFVQITNDRYWGLVPEILEAIKEMWQLYN